MVVTGAVKQKYLDTFGFGSGHGVWTCSDQGCTNRKELRKGGDGV